MVTGITSNLIQRLGLEEKVLLKFGNRLKLTKIKNGQKNTMIQIQKKKSFGAKVVVTLSNGKKIIEQLNKADAHPYGSRPFLRENYVNKFIALTNGIISKKESLRFLKIVQNLRKLKSGQLIKLNIEVDKKYLKKNKLKGIF